MMPKLNCAPDTRKGARQSLFYALGILALCCVAQASNGASCQTIEGDPETFAWNGFVAQKVEDQTQIQISKNGKPLKIIEGHLLGGISLERICGDTLYFSTGCCELECLGFWTAKENDAKLYKCRSTLHALRDTATPQDFQEAVLCESHFQDCYKAYLRKQRRK
jgi:hypothetical protein